MRQITLILALLMPVQVSAGEFRGLAVGIVAMYSKKPQPTPTPTPTPTPVPSDICDNCNGTGKLGDGTISVKCPVCDGTGKKKVATAAPVPKPSERLAIAARPTVHLGYPLRGSYYSGCSSWRHLLTGPHAGKFDPAWLAPMSYAQIQSLHADDHEGRVKWAYVQGPKAYRQGGYYEWRCVDGRGRSFTWVWVPDQIAAQSIQRR